MNRPPDPSLLLFEAAPNLIGIPNVLAALTKSELTRVVTAGERVVFKVGRRLFRQGDPHRGIFILLSGIVRTLYSAPNGREITLANWTPGNFVGGPDIFGEAPHVWSGIGVRDGKAIRLPGPVVRHLMSEVPNFAIGLVQGLAFKGKCYSSLLQMLGTRSVVERLAHLLLNLANLKGVRTGDVLVIADMPSHEELAGMVGATRQWVSITIEKLRKRGLVDVGNRRLTILRPDELRAIAGC